MTRELLYSNPDLSVSVLDIPASLEKDQSVRRIRAAEPIELPYVTPEPKGRKREALLAQVPPKEVNYHAEIEAAIDAASKVAASGLIGCNWCLPRIVPNEAQDSLPPAMHRDTYSTYTPIVLANGKNEFLTVHDLQHEVVVNGQESSQIGFANGTALLVPAHSTFAWTSIVNAYHIMKNYEHLTDKPLKFDMIVMDPPWTNRSVRKSRHYFTEEDQRSDPFSDAVKVVQAFSAPNGHVAVWITNKAAIRWQVTDELHKLGYGLVEEWIWTKVTTKGEPVTPIDGLWRKPYEILLLFQYQVNCSHPSRRIIFAVPDVHSRKPNLRVLFEQIYQPERVLELFARNLTPSWWSIGDEVVKYQDSKWWSSCASSESHG